MNIKLVAALLCGPMGLAAPWGYAQSLPGLLDGVLHTHPSLRAQLAEADLSAAQSQSAIGRLSQMLGSPLQPQLLAQSIHAPIGLGFKAHDIVVKPGITASIDVRTSTRSALSYLVKPAFKAFGGALIER